MITSIIIEAEDRTRRVASDRLPLSVGGPNADLALPGTDLAAPVAHIGLSEGEPFLQPTGTGTLTCNGTPVGASRWLYHGDVIRTGSCRILVTVTPEEVRFRVREMAQASPGIPRSGGETAKPVPVGRKPAETKTVRAVEFTPGTAAGRRVGARRRIGLVVAAVAWLPIVVLAGVTWFVLTARSIEIVIDPLPERVSLEGSLLRPGLRLGERYLARPGSYTLVAEKQGYEPLRAPLQVTRESGQSHRFTLRKLPGRISIATGAVEGAVVWIDGNRVGVTPITDLELAAGQHELRVVAERHEELTTRLKVAGAGEPQDLDLELVPRWSAITVRSNPPGATIEVGGRKLGETPATVELLEGTHTLELELAGHKPYRERIRVEANRPRTLETVELEMTDGRLAVRSDPAGATITVNGVYRGVTPADVYLPPGSDYRVELSKAGHENVSESVTVRSGRARELELRLPKKLGDIVVSARPEGAELLVDGESRGEANRTLRLLAVPHEIEIRKEGYEPFRTTVTPRPGLAQEVRAELKTAEQIKVESMPPLVRTSQQRELVLVLGGRLRMGAPRREPGRRANETLREVRLERPFYIAVTEVSNGDFREFMPEHSSGRAGTESLDYDHHPVVRVRWEDAALYCNWLSARESLPAAYETRGGRVVPVRPATTGYRLPTEAEWAFVARHREGGDPKRYPWGDSLPIPAGAENYGDASAQRLLSAALPGYDDSYPVTAPVDSFARDERGLHHLGGNVSEWVQDYYSVYASGSAAPEVDPLGPQTGSDHVIRGASWMDTVVGELRLSFRDRDSGSRADVGFRIARYAE